MAANSLYPSFIKLYYETAQHPHVMTLPVQAYLGVGGVWFLSTKSSSIGGNWTAAMDAYAVVLKALLNTADTIGRAELWTMDTPTSDPIFREAYSIGVAGTSATAAQVYAQYVISFRSETGGIFRQYVMEPAQSGVNIEVFPPFSGTALALSNFLTGATSPICARDGGWLIAPVRLLTKTNDALRKKYLLDA